MPIPGPAVHQQLMDAYRQIQSELESQRQQISQSREQRDELSQQRGKALIHLAEHYLPELTRDAIGQTWSDVRNSIEEILQRKEDHARRVQEAIRGLASRQEQQDQLLLSTTAELDQAIEARQQIADQVSQELRADERFVELSDRAAVAEAALERAEANLEEIDQDSARKLPAYDQSALFRYLYDRGYGSDEYQQRGFTRRMDRLLAKFIDFHDAKQGYDFLRRTPEQMRQIIADDRQALDTVMDELERRRDQVADKTGLPDKIRRADELQQQRQRQLESLEQLSREMDQAQQEFAGVNDTRGTYYRQAIKLFRERLEACDSNELKQRAQRTDELTDDQIVARLRGVESEIGQLDDDAQRFREELEQELAFLEAFGRMMQKFRAAQFDSARSQFVDSLGINEQVERAQEEGDIDLLWQRIRSAQRWGPTVTQQISNAASHPLSEVLVNAMAYAAGGAMESHARRAGDRRAEREFNRGGRSGKHRRR